MTTYSISITDEQVFQALWDWLTLLFPTSVEVIKGDDNRVPPPALLPGQGFIMMQRISSVRLSTNETSYTDDIIIPIEEESEMQTIDYSIQLDTYGTESANQARIISTLFRSDQACRFFEPYNIQPLYMDDPKHMPVVNGENQYEQRWMTTIHLQINPIVSVPTEFMDAASIVLVDVDATYPV